MKKKVGFWMRKMTEWQRIATVPENQRILLFCEDQEVYLGICLSKKHNHYETCCDGCGIYCEPSLLEPLYWTPLPEEPKEKDD